MAKQITIFTLNVYDNDYFNQPPSDFCRKSWHRLFESIEKQGMTYKLVEYSSKDTEYQEYAKLCFAWIEKNKDRPELLADGFRIYILSKYENYLWLDSDVYFHPGFEFIDDFSFNHHWCFIYNKDDTACFKWIFTNFYANKPLFDEHPDLYSATDGKVFKWFNFVDKDIAMMKKITHMSFVNNYVPSRVKLCNDVNANFANFDFDRILVVTDTKVWQKFVDTYDKPTAKKYVRNLKGNSELLNYVLEQFPNIKIVR